MPESLQIQLKKGVLEMCVLALLSKGDNYAYDIASRMAEAVGMESADLMALGNREMVVSLPDHPAFIGRTADTPKALRDPKELTEHALQKWGTPVEEMVESQRPRVTNRSKNGNSPEFDPTEA